MKYNFILFLFSSIMATLCLVFLGVLLPNEKINPIHESIQNKLSLNATLDVIIPSFNAFIETITEIIPEATKTEVITTDEGTAEYATIKEINTVDTITVKNGENPTTNKMKGERRDGINKTEAVLTQAIKNESVISPITSVKHKRDLSSYATTTNKNIQILKILTPRPIYVPEVQDSDEIINNPGDFFYTDWYMNK